MAEALEILCTMGLAGVMAELQPRFEQAVGLPLSVRLGPTAKLTQDIDAGASFDLAVLTAPAIESYMGAGKIAAGTRTDLARSCVGVTVQPGLPLPEIGSVEAFKRALLAAKKVCYTLNGASGKHFASLLPKLGIADEIARKALIIDGLVAERVVRGDADLGIQQISEIRAVPGSVLVGPIPEELNVHTVFSAGIGAKAKHAAAAARLLAQLTGKATREVAVAKGLELV